MERDQNHRGRAVQNHIHMLIEIPPKFSGVRGVGFLKGKSSLLIHERHGNLEYKYGEPQFLVSGILRGYDRGKARSELRGTSGIN